MTRTLFRALAVAALGSLAASALIVLVYARAPRLTFSMNTDPPPIVRGLYPVERDPSGAGFAWTGERLQVSFPGLDRDHEWTFVLRVRGGRQDPSTLPEIAVDVDGVTRAAFRVANTVTEHRVPLPVAPGRASGASIAVRVSNTFVPGPNDARSLGVVVEALRLDPPPEGVPVVPMRALGAAALAGAIFGAAFGIIGLTADRAVIAVVALAAAQAAALTHGAGPYAAWLDRLPALALWIAGGLALLVSLVRSRLPRDTAAVDRFFAVPGLFAGRIRNTALFAAVFTAAVVYLKLLVLLHPDMPIGDALFQTHRFEWVRAGRWFFTSEAPGGYQFPYAVGLYVFSLPFAQFVTGKAGLMMMLRIVVCVADAIAGALLYPAVSRATGNRLAGALAVAAFHLLPLNLQVQTVGNLTNAFAQALFVIALLLIVPGFGPGHRWRLAAALTVAAAAAMLSHTSTFAILTAVLVLAAGTLYVRGEPAARERAIPVLVAVTVAAGLAVLLYYGRFGDTYAAMADRIGTELGQPAAATDPGGRSMGQRAALVPYYLGVYYGWPLLLLAGFGLVTTARGRDALTLIVLAWLGACAGFLVLGVLTPVDLRHYLAAFPAVAILAGRGAAWAWGHGVPARVATGALLGASIAVAVRHWLGALT